LGESFKIVGDQLEAVQRGLGEMQSLATGVGDLKKVLTNVKTRGTWGEYQLGNILEQILTPDQYAKNVKPKESSDEIVEYAVRLPGHDNSSQVWLPIDSKFPQESYIRLKDASEKSDTDAIEKASAELIRTIKKSAKDISDKYIDPPHTTDFAIMFLPTEGLYAEIVRQPGMLDDLQHQRIVVAGPTNLSAILSSLSMGFRTLAIENRSSEVRKILSAVKTEFSAFGDVLSKVKTQLDRASGTIDKAGVRTRAMQKKLKDVEELPVEDSTKILGFSSEKPIDSEKD
jgi:DNA recombination protein RmuC